MKARLCKNKLQKLEDALIEQMLIARAEKNLKNLKQLLKQFQNSPFTDGVCRVYSVDPVEMLLHLKMNSKLHCRYLQMIYSISK